MVPYGVGYGYTYFVNSDGSKYELLTVLETDYPLRCEYKNYISYTGKPVNFSSPKIGESWCGDEINADYWWSSNLLNYAYVVYSS